jgi:hypothetical protein
LYEDGVIFEWDPLTDTYSKKLDILHYPHQGKPFGSMVQAVNGKFYGMVVGIPENGDHAVLFEYDPATNNYSEKADTVAGMGWYYFSDGLTGVHGFTPDTTDVVSDESYVSPSGRYTWNISGLYRDTIPGAGGCDSVIIISLTINNITGMTDNTLKSCISLYPNPTDGFFTLDLGKICPEAEITITRSDGRVILKEHITNSRFKDLQLSEAPGLYLVTITSGNERAVFKLSKK